MDEKDWPDECAYLRETPMEKQLHKRFDEVLRDIQTLHMEVEEQRWLRWGVAVAVALILWRVW
jgi:hypothetical protein